MRVHVCTGISAKTRSVGPGVPDGLDLTDRASDTSGSTRQYGDGHEGPLGRPLAEVPWWSLLMHVHVCTKRTEIGQPFSAMPYMSHVARRTAGHFSQGACKAVGSKVGQRAGSKPPSAPRGIRAEGLRARNKTPFSGNRPLRQAAAPPRCSVGPPCPTRAPAAGERRAQRPDATGFDTGSWKCHRRHMSPDVPPAAPA